MKVHTLSKSNNALITEQGHALYTFLVVSNDSLCTSWLRITTLDKGKQLFQSSIRNTKTRKLIDKKEIEGLDGYSAWAIMEVSKSGTKPYLKTITVNVAYIV